MNVIHRINSLKKKMISIVTEKRNWQNTAPILHLKINTHTKKTLLRKAGIEWNYLNLLRGFYEKHTTNIKHHNDEKNECSFLRSGTKQEVCFHHFHATLSGGSSQCTIASKRNKRHPYWKEEVKLSLCTDNMITYTENLTVFTNKLLELVSNLARLQDTWQTYK